MVGVVRRTTHVRSSSTTHQAPAPPTCEAPCSTSGRHPRAARRRPAILWALQTQAKALGFSRSETHSAVCLFSATPLADWLQRVQAQHVKKAEPAMDDEARTNEDERQQAVEDAFSCRLVRQWRRHYSAYRFPSPRVACARVPSRPRA